MKKKNYCKSSLRINWPFPILCISCLLIISLTACDEKNNTPEKVVMEKEKMNTGQLVERGRYLVTIMGCNDCHTPKKMGPMGPILDSSLLLSGHPAQMPIGDIDNKTLSQWVLFNQNLTAIVGPWGVSFTANLTSHETGIGNWTEEQFFTAIRDGKYKGMKNGRDLLPPMPWPMYRNATDDDLKAVFAYLKSTNPVSNIVPSPIPPGDLQKMRK